MEIGTDYGMDSDEGCQVQKSKISDIAVPKELSKNVNESARFTQHCIACFNLGYNIAISIPNFINRQIIKKQKPRNVVTKTPTL